MGYSYTQSSSGRWALSCDACGKGGGVRKRTCPHKVHYPEGYALPYCYPAALCNACYATRKTTLHADCREGAAKRNEQETARAARLAAGELEVRSAYGDWHERVPAGFVGVRFEGTGDTEAFRLMLNAEYQPGEKHWLSDYPTTQVWEGPVSA